MPALRGSLLAFQVDGSENTSEDTAMSLIRVASVLYNRDLGATGIVCVPPSKSPPARVSAPPRTPARELWSPHRSTSRPRSGPAPHRAAESAGAVQ
jgi:hypothetical protein